MSATDMMRVIRGIYDRALVDENPSADVDEPPSADLDGIRRLVGASHVVSTFYQGSGGTSRSCGNLGEDDRRSLGPATLSRDLTQTVRAIPEGCVRRMSSLVPMSEFLGSDMYQEIFRPLQGGNAAMTQWRTRGGWSAVSICRSAEFDRDFDDRDIAVLSVVLPHLKIAEQIRGKRVAGSGRRGRSFDRLEMLNGAALIVDAGGRPLHLNGKALKLAFGEPEFVVGKDAVNLRDAATDRLLQAAIRSAAAMGGDGKTCAEDIVSAGLSARRQILVARPLLKPPLCITVGPARGLLAEGPGSDGALILVEEREMQARAGRAHLRLVR